MRQYSSYKPSGIEWIGEIPEHWTMKKVNRSFNLVGSGTTPKAGDDKYYLEGKHNWLLTGDLNDGFIYQTSKRITNEALNDHSTLKRYPINSIVMAMYGATIGRLGILKVETTVNQACCVLANSNCFDYRIPFYYFLAIRNEIINLSFGGGQPNISQEIVKSIKLPCPPSKEQTAIANFLDRKTAEIDQAIADKKQLINLFEEEKKALINEAVTRGLNPNVKLKPSGIDWLGDIPAHWEVRKVSRSFNIIGSGTTPRAGEDKYYLNGTNNWLLTGDLNDGVINKTSKLITNEALKDHSTLKVYPKGAIVMAMYGATIGKLGILNIETTTNQACCVISSSPFFTNLFVYYFLFAIRKEIINLSFGGGQPNISQDIIKSLKIPCPSLNEQQEIISFIETETAKIDGKINLVKQEIELLTEYRQALIFEAVTGKIDVQEA